MVVCEYKQLLHKKNKDGYGVHTAHHFLSSSRVQNYHLEFITEITNVENNRALLFYQFQLLETMSWSLTEKQSIKENLTTKKAAAYISNIVKNSLQCILEKTFQSHFG